MAWIILLVAGLFEVGWAVGLKYTEGFTRLWPTVGTGVSMVLSMTRDGLISAVRHEALDLRVKVITITPKGLAALQQADKALCAAEEAVLSRVDDPSQARVQRILRKMAGVA